MISDSYFTTFAETLAPARKPRRSVVGDQAAKRQEKTLEERDRPLRMHARWRAEAVKALLAGPHGTDARAVLDFLERMDASAAGLIKHVRAGPWRTADKDIRFLILAIVDAALTRLRECAGRRSPARRATKRIPTHSGAVAMISEILSAYANAVRHDKERTSTVGASEVGQCVRKTFYAKNSDDPVYAVQRDVDHVEAWGAQLRGATFEQSVWVPALKAKYGGRLKFAGAEQRSFESGFLSATPDALLTEVPSDILAPLGIPDIESNCLLLEAKTVDPRVKLEAPKPEHKFQVIVQLGLVAEVTDFKPRCALLSYADASFWNDVVEFPIKFDASIYENAQRRAAAVMTASKASELPPEGWIAGGHECERCPFAKTCGIERHAMPGASTAVADPQFIAEIRDLACDVKRQQGIADSAETQARHSKHEIRERLRAKGLRRVSGDDFSVVWSPVKGRTSMNIAALKKAATAAGVDVTEFEQIGEPTDRLDVRVQQQR